MTSNQSDGVVRYTVTNATGWMRPWPSSLPAVMVLAYDYDALRAEVSLLTAENERLRAAQDQLESHAVDWMNERVLVRAALAEIRDQGCGCDDRDEHWTCPACIARDALDGAASVAPAVPAKVFICAQIGDETDWMDARCLNCGQPLGKHQAARVSLCPTAETPEGPKP